jgi:hypothetical protein
MSTSHGTLTHSMHDNRCYKHWSLSASALPDDDSSTCALLVRNRITVISLPSSNPHIQIECKVLSLSFNVNTHYFGVLGLLLSIMGKL